MCRHKQLIDPEISVKMGRTLELCGLDHYLVPVFVLNKFSPSGGILDPIVGSEEKILTKNIVS